MPRKKVTKENIKKVENSKLISGVLGVILSIIGLLFAFQVGVSNLLLFILFLVMVIIGIILVAKALSD